MFNCNYHIIYKKISEYLILLIFYCIFFFTSVGRNTRIMIDNSKNVFKNLNVLMYIRYKYVIKMHI